MNTKQGQELLMRCAERVIDVIREDEVRARSKGLLAQIRRERADGKPVEEAVAELFRLRKEPSWLPNRRVGRR